VGAEVEVDYGLVVLWEMVLGLRERGWEVVIKREGMVRGS
jgi:hypothetical protein